MFRKFYLFLFILIVTLIGVICFSYFTASAESVFCSGAITGKAVQPNRNVGGTAIGGGMGGTSFDSENSASVNTMIAYANQNGGVPIAGYAPEYKGYAACVDSGPTPKVYAIKGYSWNENGGFISYACNGGINEGATCSAGSISYATMLDRTLYGYAWSPVYGYINFYCGADGKNHPDGTGDDCGAIPYGIKLLKSGDTYVAWSGSYAWTESGMWINFYGITFNVPGPETPCTDATKSNNDQYVCVEINTSTGPKIANGTDGYNVDVYLRDANGVPIALADVTSLDLTFNWDDKVRTCQVSGCGNTYDAIKDKPVTASKADLLVKDALAGHYQLKNGAVARVIASYAPTYNANTSLVSLVLNFYNETFVLGTDHALTPSNHLISIKVDYDMTTIVTSPLTKAGYVFVNGESAGTSLDYKPLVYLEKLDAPDLQDSDYDSVDVITAYRELPVPLTLKLSGAESSMATPAGLNIDLYAEVDPDANCGGMQFVFTDEMGEPLQDEEFHKNYTSDEFFIGTEQTIHGKLRINPDNPENTCDQVRVAVYSKISYSKDGKSITYYSNKLPRMQAGVVANLPAQIIGNIYTQFADLPSEQAEPVLTTGDLILNIVKNTVNKNRSKYKRLLGEGGGASCLDDECSQDPRGFFDAGQKIKTEGREESVTYIKRTGPNKDVTISYDPDYAGEYKGRNVLIVEGGDLKINTNIYDTTRDTGNPFSLVIVVLKSSDGAGGNVYIDSSVTNIQATIVADGSVFPSIDNPSVPDVPKYPFKSSGLTDCTTQESNFSTFFDNLSKYSSQLLIEGSISSRNTVGGADVTKDRDYLVFGDGTTAPKNGLPLTRCEKLRAQLYDLNYLRLFSLKLRFGADGKPVDQQCPENYGPACDDIIDATKSAAQGGDLVVPDGLSKAEWSHNGATAGDSKDYPLYIYYTSVKSFLFNMK